jgi:pyrimidine-nucleoside phosphorylase
MAGRKTVGVITDMDEPLGYAVGNALEVKEAIAVLKGEEKGELLELCLTLGSCILTEAGFAANDDAARKMLEEHIADGSALDKLADLVEGQYGDRRAVYDISMLPAATVTMEVPSPESGHVSHIQADSVGLVSMHLGGGRATKDSVIDLSVGLVLHKKVGDMVDKGESLATIHASSPEKAREAAKLLEDCYTIVDAPVVKAPFIKGIVR